MAGSLAGGITRSGVFSAVHHPRFRRLWIASIMAGVANMTVLTVRSWVAFDLFGQSTTVGLVVFASFLPSLLITPFSGVFADRYDRRTMLVILHGIGLLSTVGLAWFVWAGIKNPWPLVALSFINGGARSSSTPAEQAMLSSVVPGRDLLNAVSLLQANLNGSRLVGPLLAAPLLVVGGGAGAFLVAVLLYGVAIWQVWSMGPVAHERSGAEGNAVAQMAQGVRYAVQTPVVFSLIALVFLHCAFVMGFDAALPQLAADRLGATGKEYSVLVMAIGAGSLIGAFTLAGLARRAHRGNLLFATSILSGLTMAPLAYATSWPAALISAALLGMTQSMFIALATTSLQLVTPDRVRGRILALYWGASGGVMAFANLFTGRLADTFGVAPAIAVPGLLFIAVTCLTLLAPTLRTIYGRRAVSVAAPA